MSKQVDAAMEAHAQGFNCSQSVAIACGPALGLDREMAIRLGEGFGGGFGRTGNVCGAVTGAILCVGLKHNRGSDAQNAAGRGAAQKCVQEFLKRFQAVHGSLLCRELLGSDISTDEGFKAARDSGAIKDRCPKFICSAVEIAEDLLK
jgi:C_GCAxxG_C_C family probable redox protein